MHTLRIGHLVSIEIRSDIGGVDALYFVEIAMKAFVADGLVILFANWIDGYA